MENRVLIIGGHIQALGLARQTLKTIEEVQASERPTWWLASGIPSSPTSIFSSAPSAISSFVAKRANSSFL